MSTIKTLAVKHTATRHGLPLVSFVNLPGPDPDLTPDAIRQLAAALLTIADDCEAHHRGVRRAVDVRREYPVGG